ncbi:hypothetical protein EUV02_10205 [Polymorphobacter arshaanensis]|uniref:Uncharacterized protein n=1 Tax=Glacieibacterium arshaanense TaxID=2511025 RepID=A0A4Y9EN78_9SPHN|nr:hypothetical protein [Polymorphobacter arshaanensis]TFU03526.1 hypothetical protein EUV02_10205 [Polymorphobacter arshaanensis]
MSMPNSPTPAILTERFVAFPYEVGYVRGANKERYFYLAIANPHPVDLPVLVRLVNWTGDELVSPASYNNAYEFTGPWPFRYTLHPGQSVLLKPVVPNTEMMGWVDIWSSAKPLLHAWTTMAMFGATLDIAAVERDIPIRNMNVSAMEPSPSIPTTPGSPPPARSGPAPTPGSPPPAGTSSDPAQPGGPGSFPPYSPKAGTDKRAK